jgi:uncharacterized protein (DUF1501 family)
MATFETCGCREHLSRRQFLRTGFFGLGFGAALPGIFGQASAALAAQTFHGGAEPHPERILVVVELSGGNDGLDTLIPYGDDAYHRARPTLRHTDRSLLRVDDYLAVHPSLGGLKRILDDGLVAVVQGCGYPNPNRSHFSSMEYWHTAVPNQAEARGWIGRLADGFWPEAPASTLVNVAKTQSLAVQSQHHAPVVFSDPEQFVRAGDAKQAASYAKLIEPTGTGNATLDFLASISRDANATSLAVRETIRDYRSPVSYGSTPLAADLRKVAALIGAGFPTRVYYTSLGGFDTHASQASGRFYLLTGVGEALRAFHDDLRRLGRQQDVAVMMFSEFGRRVEENASLGTDHGTAGPMFVMGAAVKPGFYGKHPSLTDLDESGDLEMTTDFRRVYATMVEEWLGYRDVVTLLRGHFEPLGIFA